MSPALRPTTRPRASHLPLVVLVLLATFLAGCHEDAAEPIAEEEGAGTDAAALRFDAVAPHGEILVDDAGRVLYVFTNDEPGKSNCYDQCAANWPPLVAEELPGAPAVIAGDVSLVERTDGSTQVAHNEMPLYYFQGDAGPGEASGDGRNGVWFVVPLPPANSEMLNDAGPHEVEESDVDYFMGTIGRYARPSDGPATAGVVMIHEWWGLNDNIRDMAHLLATHGYAVLAVDLVHGNVATTSAEAQAQVRSLDQEEATANMRAAAAHLRDQGVEKVFSLGWCFGGGQSLQLALSGEELAGTVIYYGFLVDDEEALSAIQWPVLGIFGELDQAIPIAAVRSFETSLDNLTVENEILIYPEVGHAFANPSGDAWAPDQTADAWSRTLRFLDRLG